MGEWLEKDLPKRYAGVSTCFRKEAGSSGWDIGIFRVHHSEESNLSCKDDIEESKMGRNAGDAEEFYQSLEFPYRVVTIVSAELNDAAIKSTTSRPGSRARRHTVSSYPAATAPITRAVAWAFARNVEDGSDLGVLRPHA